MQFTLDEPLEPWVPRRYNKPDKKVNTNNKNEPRAIGICTKTIFNNKGLTRGKFRCKNKRYVNFNKTKKNRK